MSRERKVVYSTDPGFQEETPERESATTLPPGQQDLRVHLDRKQRKGKTVTLVTGFVGSPADLNRLAGTLKRRCGVGGSAKDGEIIVQGELRERVMAILEEMGYKAKKVGG